MPSTVEIYGPSYSNFVRTVQLVCEEKQVPYAEGNRLRGQVIEFQSDAHTQLHPFTKVPILAHGDRTLVETAPICRYLDRTFDGPNLQPEDPWEQAQHDQWCALINTGVDHAVVRNYLQEFVFPTGPDGKPHLDHLMTHRAAAQQALRTVADKLAGNPFLLGEKLTLADCFLAPIAHYASQLPSAVALLDSASPLHCYVQRLQARASGAAVLATKRARA